MFEFELLDAVALLLLLFHARTSNIRLLDSNQLIFRRISLFSSAAKNITIFLSHQRIQMSVGDVDQITVEINQNLGDLLCKPSEPSIFKVDNHLRSGGWDSVYDPEIVSIGPYHHGKSHLQNMELLKYQYLKQLLKRKNEESNRYVTAVAAMEERARKCYGEPLKISRNEFVKMMVLDGCFLIELIRCHGFKELRDVDDRIFRHEGILSQLRHDIFLLENQLPFFLLNQLFNMTKTEDPEDDIILLTLRFIDGMFLNLTVPKVIERIPSKNIDHIFGLIHFFLCLPFSESISQRKLKKTNAGDSWGNINSISGLREAGIKFKRAKGNGSLMDIKFVNGVLRIPQLNIFDETESQLRNLIAFEQYLPDGEPRYVSDYTFFLHCLINTPNDVKLLRSHGIIGNWFGDDEEVSRMFNRLGKNILTSSNFSYSHVFVDVNKQCFRRRNKWKATLQKNYFNSPWSIISFLAAFTLLFLTLMQTAYTMLSYYKRTR